MGFPCCPALPFVDMPPPLPRWSNQVHVSLTSLIVTAFPEFQAGRPPHCPFRGLLDVHSRCGLFTRQVADTTFYTEGFGRFVASTPAPIATGWSESCRVGFAPTERACLSTAH